MSLQTIIDSLPDFKSDEIIKSFVKGYSIINRDMYKQFVREMKDKEKGLRRLF